MDPFRFSLDKQIPQLLTDITTVIKLVDSVGLELTYYVGRICFEKWNFPWLLVLVNVAH